MDEIGCGGRRERLGATKEPSYFLGHRQEEPGQEIRQEGKRELKKECGHEGRLVDRGEGRALRMEHPLGKFLHHEAEGRKEEEPRRRDAPGSGTPCPIGICTESDQGERDEDPYEDWELSEVPTRGTCGLVCHWLRRRAGEQD